jgi:thiamine transport system substrate-binding protein
MNRRPLTLSLVALVGLLGLSACGSSGGSSGSTAPLTLLTYEAFTEPAALKRFTEDTGITVKVAKSGDAGTLVNKAILTAGHPEGDVLWGVDNTLLSRAVDKNLFVPYKSSALSKLNPTATALVPGHQVTPVDTGDVCLNYDKQWFAKEGVKPPASLDDLADPAYKGLTVVENPATSSPGLAFLLATIAHSGDPGFVDYWKALRKNGVLVVDDWDTAYYSSFTAGGSVGHRPIVVSYSTSPPATIYYAKEPKPTEPTTASVDSSCFGQVEFAGILRGTKHATEARRLIDFLVGVEFQDDLPLSNFVYPVRKDATLPDLFVRFARPVSHPLTVPPDEITAHRDEWIKQWTNAVLR